MKKRLLWLLLLFPVLSFANLHKDGDFQIWQYSVVDSKVTDKFTFRLLDEFRWGNNASQLFFVEARIHLMFHVTPWLSIDPIYRQIYFLSPEEITTSLSTSRKNRWEPEYSPALGLNFTKNVKGFEISDRNWALLLMYDKSFGKNLWEYRNRLKVITPWSFSKLGIRPVISDEIFFLQTRGFRENRFFVGLLTPFNETVNFLIGYQLRSIRLKRDGWLNTNILRLSLRFGF